MCFCFVALLFRGNLFTSSTFISLTHRLCDYAFIWYNLYEGDAFPTPNPLTPFCRHLAPRFGTSPAPQRAPSKSTNHVAAVAMSTFTFTLGPEEMVPCGKNGGDVPLAVLNRVGGNAVAICGSQTCFQRSRKVTYTCRCSFCQEQINVQSPLEVLIKLNKATRIQNPGLPAVVCETCCILCFPRYLMHWDSTPCNEICCRTWHDMVAELREIPAEVPLAIQNYASSIVLPNAVARHAIVPYCQHGAGAAQSASSGADVPPPPSTPPPRFVTTATAAAMEQRLQKQIDELSERLSALAEKSSGSV